MNADNKYFIKLTAFDSTDVYLDARFIEAIVVGGGNSGTLIRTTSGYEKVVVQSAGDVFAKIREAFNAAF